MFTFYFMSHFSSQEFMRFFKKINLINYHFFNFLFPQLHVFFLFMYEDLNELSVGFLKYFCTFF